MSTKYFKLNTDPAFSKDNSFIPPIEQSLTLTQFAMPNREGKTVPCGIDLAIGSSAFGLTVFPLTKEKAVKLAYQLLKPYSGDAVTNWR